jgi:hypothetical protein
MTKKHLKHLLLLPLFAGIFYACLDEISSWRTERLSPEVEAAKAWYESMYGEEYYLSWQVGDDNEFFLTPDWGKTFFNSDSAYLVTETCFKGDEVPIMVSNETAEMYEKTGDKRYLVSDMRLVVRTNKETGDKDGFIMVVYPDLVYLEKNLNNPLRKFSYLHRDKDFSGYVYYFDLEGQFVNAWWYAGSDIHALFSSSILEAEPQLRSITCYWHCPVYQYSFGLEVGGEELWTNPQYSFGNCYITFCVPMGGNSNSGSNSGSNPGEYNPSGNTPGNSIDAPNASKMLSANMSKDHWDALERRIKDMLRDDNCAGKGLYNGLNTALGGAKVNYVPQGGLNGRFDAGTNTMYVGTDIGTNNTNRNISGTLFHEMVHAFQRHGNQPFPSNTEYNANATNREVEAWLAVYYYSQINRDTESHWDNKFNNPNDELGKRIKDLAEHIGHMGNLKTNEEAAKRAINNVALQLQAEGLASINRPINNPDNIAATFSNMGTIFGGC